ncbi:MAG: hypothetical protein OK439_04515 [Thaumarchaeota archaeon]|nr:hypothetical protein [Nitrososphaerota archaeon]
MRKTLNEAEYKERIKHWDTSKLSDKAASDVAWLGQFLEVMKKVKQNDIKEKTNDIESMTRTLEELELIEEELQGRDPKYVLTAGVWRGKLKDFT